MTVYGIMRSEGEYEDKVTWVEEIRYKDKESAENRINEIKNEKDRLNLQTDACINCNGNYDYMLCYENDGKYSNCINRSYFYDMEYPPEIIEFEAI